MSINSVCITGNVGQDPELRTTASGMAVLSFRVAVNDRVKGKSGDWEDYTNWIPVTLFGGRGESLSRYISKGTKVAVSGRLRYSTWEKDGAKRNKIEVIADDIDLCGGGQRRSDDDFDLF